MARARVTSTRRGAVFSVREIDARANSVRPLRNGYFFACAENANPNAGDRHERSVGSNTEHVVPTERRRRYTFTRVAFDILFLQYCFFFHDRREGRRFFSHIRIIADTVF